MAPVAAERVYQKLSHRLARLITPVGCQALLTRVVHLSSGLRLVDEAHGPRRADGLPPRVFHASESAELTRGCEVAILGSLIALLVSFIGEELTFRILREVWPELPMDQLVQHTHQNGTRTRTVEMTN